MRRFSCARRRGSADGFTLVELLVAMVIFGVLGTIAVWALRGYQQSQEFSGTAHKVVSSLRNVAERAQSEGRTYCVQFAADGKSWDVWRYSCDSSWTNPNGTSPVKVESNDRVQGSSVALTNVAFTAATGVGSCPAGSGRCVYFYPRGTANAGKLGVSMGGKTFTVNVEGLTGRVYLG